MKVLATELAPTCDAVLRLANIREAASTTTDIAMLVRWIAKNQCMRSDIARHDRPRTYERKLPNGYTANDECSSPNGCSILYKCRRNFPVICAFQLASRCDCARSEVIGEAYMRANENTIL